ncbi:MAG: helix-turn-helix domain-containing protein [Oscillospiraceae bacterium]|nr:helix-turn-helix domain-containing protein [Oscillospiraceae bacterium]
MQYHEKLNELFQKYSLSAKRISQETGISTVSISRYRSGKRKPDPETVQALTSAVIQQIEQSGTMLSPEEKDSIRDDLIPQDSVFHSEHFDLLVSKLNIRLTDLAPQVGYSVAYLSSIKLGKRRPADKECFLSGLCAYLTMHRQRESDWKVIRILTGCESSAALPAALEQWLWGTDIQKKDSISKFLHHLDNFDLNQYMTTFHFEPPAIPASFDVSTLCGDYIGTERMRDAELNFFRMTLLSDSTEPIFMHNEMSLTDMAQDMEFNKNWMLSIAMCLKKGLHLDIIHDVDRPQEEMILGLHAWVPLYMTGQISPYYLKTQGKQLYHHTQYLSGGACLSGSCIMHDDAYYTLTNQPNLMKMGALRKINALKAAHPLMDIYREETDELYGVFLQLDAQSEGKRIGIHPTLPFYTLPEELLLSILKRHHASEAETERLLLSLRKAKEQTEQILRHSEITAAVPELSETEFSDDPLRLALTDTFCHADYAYTYAEYQAHLQQTKAFAESYSRFTLLPQKSAIFRNIRIKIKLHEWVMISKSNAPVVHFVVRHPKLVAAIENYCIGKCFS